MILNHVNRELSFDIHEQRYALKMHIFKDDFATQSTKKIVLKKSNPFIRNDLVSFSIHFGCIDRTT